MAKRYSKTPVAFDKSKFLLPTMVPYPAQSGLYFKELGGDALLVFKDYIDELKEASRGRDRTATLPSR